MIMHGYVIITKGFVITHYYTFETDELADEDRNVTHPARPQPRERADTTSQ